MSQELFQAAALTQDSELRTQGSSFSAPLNPRAASQVPAITNYNPIRPQFCARTPRLPVAARDALPFPRAISDHLSHFVPTHPPRNSLNNPLFTTFTFVTRCIHDFHAKIFPPTLHCGVDELPESHSPQEDFGFKARLTTHPHHLPLILHP